MLAVGDASGLLLGLQYLTDPRGRFLATTNAGLLEVLTPAGFREDAVLLDPLIEAFERGFKAFVVSDNNFCQGLSSFP